MGKQPQPRNKPPRTGDRVPLGLRTTPQLQQALSLAAERNGRSLSQETEFRLERSIERRELFAEVLELKYGQHVGGLLAVVGEAMQHTLELVGINCAQSKAVPPPGQSDTPADQDWLADAYAYEEVVKAAILALRLFQPKESARPTAAEKAALAPGAWANEPGRRAVRAIAAELTGRTKILDGRDDLARVRPLLSGLPKPAMRDL